MTLNRPLVTIALRALAVTLVAAASLQLALHTAETIFLMRHGPGGGVRFELVLACAGAIAVGTWLYHRSRTIADRL